jgi:hypothetical protein
MRLYLLRYITADAELLSLAIVEAYDPILARWTAFAAGIHYPGAISTADEVDLASVVPELIGRKLFPDDLPIRRPSTLWVRRGERKEGRKPAGVGPHSRRALQGRRKASSQCPRRHSLGDDRGPAPDSNVTGRVFPYRFVHEVQRGHLVVRFADHGMAVLRDQFDFEFAHGPAFQKRRESARQGGGSGRGVIV